MSSCSSPELSVFSTGASTGGHAHASRCVHEPGMRRPRAGMLFLSHTLPLYLSSPETPVLWGLGHAWFSAMWVCRRTPSYLRASLAASTMRPCVTVKGEQGARPMRSMEYLRAIGLAFRSKRALSISERDSMPEHDGSPACVAEPLSRWRGRHSAPHGSAAHIQAQLQISALQGAQVTCSATTYPVRHGHFAEGDTAEAHLELSW